MRRSSIALLAFAVCTLLAAAGEVGPDAPPIRIGSFNIRYANDGDGPNAWRHRSAMVLGILRSADFWGLQEALPGQIEDIRTGCAEFAVLARTRDADPATGEACPILYRADRWDLDADEHGTFWLSESPEVAGSKSWDSSLPRICTFARFRSKDGGRAFYLFNTHFDHRGSAARLEAARLLVKRIGARRHPDPVLVTGDLNCGPSSEPVKALLGDAAAGLRDAWRETNPDAPEQPSFNGWRDACEGDRIDWILVAGELDVESAAIDASKREGRWPSDHAFVRAEFVWRAPPAAE